MMATKKDHTELLELLEQRFENNKARHEGLKWKDIQTKLEKIQKN